jgi:hypothetical protein
MSEDTSIYLTRKEFEEYKKSLGHQGPVKETPKEQVKEPKRTRAPNTYNLFMKEEMERIKKKDPSISPTQALKLVGEAWRSHKDSSKA